MKQEYRKGAVGALMDEYERAAAELRGLVGRLTDEQFTRIVDPQTRDDNCRSVQTIMSHVVSAGYGYATEIRAAFSMAQDRPPKRLLSRQESLDALDAMLRHTALTLEGKWEMTEEDIVGTVIHSPWRVTYDLEQWLEHAIVHILRHRRQVEKFISGGGVAERPG